MLNFFSFVINRIYVLLCIALLPLSSYAGFSSEDTFPIDCDFVERVVPTCSLPANAIVTVESLCRFVSNVNHSCSEPLQAEVTESNFCNFVKDVDEIFTLLSELAEERIDLNTFESTLFCLDIEELNDKYPPKPKNYFGDPCAIAEQEGGECAQESEPPTTETDLTPEPDVVDRIVGELGDKGVNPEEAKREIEKVIGEIKPVKQPKVESNDVSSPGSAMTLSPDNILFIEFSGNGNGFVNVKPSTQSGSGGQCRSTHKKCDFRFKGDDTIALEAIPDDMSVFTGWTGIDPDCRDGSVILNENTSCTAHFLPKIPAAKVLKGFAQVSTRCYVEKLEENNLFLDFLIQGEGDKEVRVNVIGEQLRNAGLSTVTMPITSLFLPEEITLNGEGSWKQKFSAARSLIRLSPDSLPGGLTMVVLEELTPDTNTQITEIRSGCFILPQPEQSMYVGFETKETMTLLIQASGKGVNPSTTFTNLDPYIVMRSYPDGQIIASNDNWATDNSIIEKLKKLGHSPTVMLDAVILIEVPKGIYTIELKPSNNVAGTAQLTISQID